MKRPLVIILSLLGAAAIFALAVLLGAPVPTNTGVPLPPPPPSLGADNTPDAVRGRSLADGIGQSSDGYFLLTEGEGSDIRRTLFSWAEARPLPGGASEVTRPLTLIYFGNPAERIIRIAADEGEFLAPENNPRSGRFVGNVTLTVFSRRPDTRSIDTGNPANVDFRVFLDEPAKFDVEFGEVLAAGPVHVTGPQLEFFGSDLTLKYNRLRNRIEELTVEHGRSLRVQTNPPNAPPTATASPPIDTSATQPATTQPATTQPDNDANPRPVQFYLARFNDDVRVDLPDELGRMDGDQLALRFSLNTPREDVQTPLVNQPPPASRFTVRLANNQAVSREAERSLFIPQPDDLIVTWSGPLTLRPLLNPPDDLTHPEDVEVALTGTPGNPATAITPKQESVSAARLAFLRSKAQLTAEAGEDQPVVFDAPDLGRLEAQSLVIDQSTAQGTATGPGLLVFRDDPPPTDALTAPPATQPATQPSTQPATQPDTPPVLAVEWTDELQLRLFTNPDPADDPDLPEGFTAPDATLGLRSATFKGAVRTRHADLLLNAQALTVEFDNTLAASQQKPTVSHRGTSDDPLTPTTQSIDPPNPRPQNRSIPRQIVATGSVDIQTTERDDPKQTLDLTAEYVAVELANQPADNDPDASPRLIPTSLRASQNVVAAQPAARLTSRQLDVFFATAPPATSEPPLAPGSAGGHAADPMSPASTPPATPPTTQPANPPATQPAHQAGPLQRDGGPPEPDDRPRITIAALTANGDVTYTDEADDLRITAETLIASPDEERLTLNGSPGTPAFAGRPATPPKPATLTRGNDQLAGRLIVLDQPSQTATVTDAGSFTTLTQPDDPEDPTARLSVTWTRAMALDNLAGTARFEGAVNARTRSQTDQSLLQTHTLDLTFEPDPDDTSAAGTQPATQPATDPDTPRNRIRTALATGGPGPNNQALFTALANSATATKPPNPAEQRLRLAGPTLRFANTDTQTLTVAGPGSMLLEDYRPPPPPEENAEQDPPNRETTNPANLTGRGATLFAWPDSGNMVLDATVNDMTITGGARMVHRPHPPEDDSGQPKPLATLDAITLVVDLDDAGGLGPLSDGDQPSPDINTITAVGSVLIDHAPRRLAAHHLRYTADNQLLRLTADPGTPGSVVTVEDANQPAPLQAESVLWDLIKDEIRATGIRGGTAPVRR
ncbi:MAG: hypothetical protein AAGI68_08275 [Planctomycetota bacterium]